jgi:hypothetical protein
MEVPRVVWLDRTPPRRYLDPKRELLVLFPASHLHFDQHHPHFIELAVQTLNQCLPKKVEIGCSSCSTDLSESSRTYATSGHISPMSPIDPIRICGRGCQRRPTTTDLTSALAA